MGHPVREGSSGSPHLARDGGTFSAMHVGYNCFKQELKQGLTNFISLEKAYVMWRNTNNPEFGTTCGTGYVCARACNRDRPSLARMQAMGVSGFSAGIGLRWSCALVDFREPSWCLIARALPAADPDYTCA